MVRLISGNGLRVAGIAIAGLFLAACEPTAPGYGGPGYGGPGYGPPPAPPGGGRICTRIYDPVCATRGRQSQTFPNACEAQSAGWDIRHGGQCRSSGRPGHGGPGPGSRPQRPEFCTSIYQPVCGSNGGRARTYENECMMRQDGAREVPNRYCRRG
ncbi:Kazal-type serine protease inhibitor family protein [Pseudohoeflea suaedae]|uniref:Kazal-type serine protease inhibitor family protein n=1 Tax=Pseudohoeflea suaedae TaxID=877384 RepID=UPI001304C0C5|nr:Kazal-type serine protease inhibitor domain-containing protein [Pseudohoeflea suaedae]